jgi:hypothetical protein
MKIGSAFLCPRIAAILVALPLLAGGLATPVLAQDAALAQRTGHDAAPRLPKVRNASPVDVKMAAYEFLRTIEQALGLDNTGSNAVLQSGPELFGGMKDPDQFVANVRYLQLRSDAAITAARNAGPDLPVALYGNRPVPPNYPGRDDLTFIALKALGLVTNPGDRVQGTFAWRVYEGVLATLEPFLFTYRQAVAIAACDPTGAACLIATPILAACEVSYHVAAIPSEMVKNWESWLDSAENEAAWKNSALLLGDLASHDSRILDKLSGQDAAVSDLGTALALHDGRLATHDQEVKALINQLGARLLANQLEIIKLLKTPEGRRPGFGKEGY